MPRRHLPSRKAKARLFALKLEKAQYEIVRLRREHRAREEAVAFRNSTPDWVEMEKRLRTIELEAELDAMELSVDERRVKVPVLNYNSKPAHYDVANEPVMTGNFTNPVEPWEVACNKIKRPSPPNGKDWQYPATLEGRHPADDWRNWEPD